MGRAVRPWRLVPVLLALLCVCRSARADADAPTWPGLSTLSATDGGSRVLLRRSGAPTLAVCARAQAMPQLSDSATATLLRRAGQQAIRRSRDGWEVCLRLPAQELTTALWALQTATLRPAEATGHDERSALSALLAPGTPAARPPTLAVVGDFDVDAAARILRELRWPAPTPPSKPTSPQAQTWTPPSGLQLVGWKAPARGTAPRAAMEVAATLLARNLSEHHGRSVRADSGTHLVFLRIHSKDSSDALRRALLKELAQLQRIPPRQLAAAVVLTESALLQELDDNAGVARSLLDGVDAQGQPRSVLRHLSLVSGLSGAAVSSAVGFLALENSAWLPAPGPAGREAHGAKQP